MYFVVIWSSAILAIPVAVAALIIAARGFVVSNVSSTAWIGLTVSLVATLWTLLLRLHEPRVLIRAGAWPLCCADNAMPRTEADLRRHVRRIVSLYGRPPQVVGSGWGFFLQRTKARGPLLCMHRYRGRIAGEPARWRAGTTIAKVVDDLEREGATLSTHPTMDYICVGSWFSHGNHGNGGDVAIGSSATLEMARVLNMRTDCIEKLTYAEVRRRFDGVGNYDPLDYCVIDVSLTNLVRNRLLQKRAIKIDGPRSASEWLALGARLRVCFQGAARNYAFGLRWEDPKPSGFEGHRDPHCCSACCLYMQTDVCSAFGGWHEKMGQFTSSTTHRHANQWMPAVLPLQTVGIILLGYRNFEAIFKIDTPLTGMRLWSMIDALQKLHATIGGRSEFRYGVPRASTPIFLDCSLRHSFHMLFELLARPPFDVRELALHPGKALLSTFPCKRVTLAQMYGMDVSL